MSMLSMRTAIVLVSVLVSVFFSPLAAAAGIDCAKLPNWSAPINDYQVNLHHVFCGEAGKNDAAKGFHVMQDGQAPSSYVSSQNADKPNAAGIYTLKNIILKFGDREYTKSFSSMFPKHCSIDQIKQSIVYSLANTSGPCSNPGWASCGQNAPVGSTNQQFCLGSNGNQFTIATATLRGEPKKINTGFPIYTK